MSDLTSKTDELMWCGFSKESAVVRQAGRVINTNLKEANQKISEQQAKLESLPCVVRNWEEQIDEQHAKLLDNTWAYIDEQKAKLKSLQTESSVLARQEDDAVQQGLQASQETAIRVARVMAEKLPPELRNMVFRRYWLCHNPRILYHELAIRAPVLPTQNPPTQPAVTEPPGPFACHDSECDELIFRSKNEHIRHNRWCQRFVPDDPKSLHNDLLLKKEYVGYDTAREAAAMVYSMFHYTLILDPTTARRYQAHNVSQAMGRLNTILRRDVFNLNILGIDHVHSITVEFGLIFLDLETWEYLTATLACGKKRKVELNLKISTFDSMDDGVAFLQQLTPIHDILIPSEASITLKVRKGILSKKPQRAHLSLSRIYRDDSVDWREEMERLLEEVD